jgi:hypothetical protein
MRLIFSKSVLDKNFIELTQFIKDYEMNEEIITNGELDRKLTNEIVRLLQNYVASDYSYSEHAYRIVELLDDKLREDFIKEREKIRRDENVAFIRDLRRYSQHCSIIRQTTHVMFTRVNMDKPLFHSQTSVELSRESLVEWKDWSSKSKIFIKNMDGHIKLIIPLAKQLKKINELHKWLIDAIYDRFDYELTEYNTLVSKIIELQEKRKNKG